MKKILLVMSAIAVLFLTGCQNADNDNNNIPQDDVNQRQEVIMDNQEINEKGKEEQVKLIEDLYIKSINNRSAFKLPKINIDSDSINKTNNYFSVLANKIDEDLNNCDTEEFICTSNIEEFDECLVGCDYSYYVNGDILSLVVNYHGMETHEMHDVYNMDIKKNSIISNSELLGLTDDEIENRVEVLFQDDLIYKQLGNGERNYYPAVRNTHFDFKTVKFYYDAENKLHIIGTIPDIEIRIGAPNWGVEDLILENGLN